MPRKKKKPLTLKQRLDSIQNRIAILVDDVCFLREELDAKLASATISEATYARLDRLADGLGDIDSHLSEADHVNIRL